MFHNKNISDLYFVAIINSNIGGGGGGGGQNYMEQQNINKRPLISLDQAHEAKREKRWHDLRPLLCLL